MFKVWVGGLAVAVMASLPALSAAVRAAPFADVGQDRLEAADTDVDNWLTHGRTYSEQRYSRLEDINDTNVQDLAPAWSVELDTNRGQEATPLVVDGVMYVSTAWSKVMALDAASGEVLWQFDPQADGAQASHACCDFVNRGVAVWEGRVYVGTIDGRLIALDARTGDKVWDVLTIDKSKPYTITMAPRVVRGKVIIGNSGAEMGVRGYVSAYDAESGELVWRFYTVPGNPADGPDGAASDKAIEELARPTWFGRYWELGGGGTVWDSVVYDEELDQLLVGVGNGSPWNQKIRSDGKGDNLFLASILALDPDTGAYKWHYQVNPGETWDYTATQQIMLADLEIDGEPRKVLMQAPKNGFFYVIDRTTGKLISAEPFVPQNWAERIDLETGRPVERPGMRFEDGPVVLYPSGLGGHSWMPMSHSPATGLVYLPTIEQSTLYVEAEPFEIHEGRWNTGLGFGAPPPGAAPERSAPARLLAWDPVAQKVRWSVERQWIWNGGTLSTAGNLVFQGTGHGEFEAYSADEGEKLWSIKTNRSIMAGPITYRVDGEQYVAVMGGYGGAMGVASPAPFIPGRPPSGVILAFKIAGEGDLSLSAPEVPVAPTPSSEQFTSAQVQAGGEIYGKFCAICHGGVVNPNLPRSPLIAHKDAFRQVVMEGAFTVNGMPSFAPYLEPAEAEAVRAFLNEQAKALLANEAGK